MLNKLLRFSTRIKAVLRTPIRNRSICLLEFCTELVIFVENLDKVKQRPIAWKARNFKFQLVETRKYNGPEDKKAERFDMTS